MTSVTESTVSLSWSEPADDGGSEITGYILERRDSDKRSFSKETETEEEEFTVSKLKEGKKYLFRVAAVNEVGTGEFVELPEAAVPKSQFSK